MENTAINVAKKQREPIGEWPIKQIIVNFFPHTTSIKTYVKLLQPGRCDVLMKLRHQDSHMTVSIGIYQTT